MKQGSSKLPYDFRNLENFGTYRGAGLKYTCGTKQPTSIDTMPNKPHKEGTYPPRKYN